MDNIILKKNSSDSHHFCNSPDSIREYIQKETNIKEVVFDKIVGNLKTECQTIFPAYVEDTMDPYNEEEFDKVDNFFKIVKPFNKFQNNHEECSTEDFNVSELNVLVTNKQNHDLTNFNSEAKNLNTSSHSSESQMLKPTTFSINTHNCSKFCVWCQKSFAVFDNPNHIGRIRNIEKQNAFFKIEASLKIDSCLCDRCWKYLEKTYKLKESEKRREIEVTSVSNNVIKVETETDDIVMETLVKKSSNSVKRNKRSKRSRKKNFQPDICSVYNCSQYSVHPIPIDECKQLKNIFSMFDFSSIIFVESKIKIKQSVSSSLSVCEEHLHLVDVVTTCQLCGNKLNGNLDSEIWKMYDKYNWRLLSNNIPLILKPGMFLCNTCESYISENYSSSKVDLENMRQNVEKRYNARMKLFGPPLNVPSDNSQGSNVDPPLVVAKIIKHKNCTKVKFSEPLITVTHYYEPDKKGHHSRNERQDCPKIELDLLTNSKVLYSESKTTNSVPPSSLTDLSILYNDKLPQIVTEKFINSIKLEPNNEEFDELETSTSILDSENYLSPLRSKNENSPTQYRNINETESMADYSVIMPNSKLSASSENYKEHYPESLTKHIVLNDTFNQLSNVHFSSNQNAISASMDVDKDLLPLHVLNLLDNDENKMSENIKTDKNEQVITSIDSPQSVSSFKEVETSENKHVFTSVHSVQKDCKIKSETCKNKPVLTNLSYSRGGQIDDGVHQYGPMITEVYSQQNADHVNLGKKSMDFNEDNQNINVKNELNVKTVYLNESSLASLYSSLPVEESLKVKADSVEIRKKLRHVVYQRISHGGVKKQRLNKPPELDEISLQDSENETDSSYKNMSTDCDGSEFYRDENIIYHRPNLPSIVSTYSHNTGENILYSDYSTDVQYYISSDEDETCKPNDNNLVEYSPAEELNTYEESFKSKDDHFTKYTSNEELNTYEKTNTPKDNHFIEYTLSEEENACNETYMSKGNNFKENTFAKELNSNEPLIHIDKIYSLDPIWVPTIKFRRTLRKVPDFYNKMSCEKKERNSDNNIASDSDILSDDSQEHKTSYNNNDEQLKSNPVPDPKSFSKNIESSPLTTDETNDSVQFVNNQCDKQDDKKDIHFQLNNSNSFIYESLKERFNDTELFMYLMENQRMLLNKELVLSNNSNSYVSNYIQKYMRLLHGWYGDPDDCNASKSFLPVSSYVRQYSRRFSPDRELPVVTQGINSLTSSKSSRSHVLTFTSKEIDISRSNNTSQVQNNVSTNTTYTLSTPIASKRVFNCSSAAQPTVTSINSTVNLQKPAVFRFASSPSRPTCYRAVPQPSFQLPTAVRSGSTPFTQMSRYRPTRPNFNTHYGIRNPFNRYMLVKKQTHHET